MKQLFLLLLLIWFFWIQNVSASFLTNTWTPVSSSTTFDKVHSNATGKKLYLYEDYTINPFSGVTITANYTQCSWSGCNWAARTLNGYSINGTPFGSSHPLYKNVYENHENWSTSNWIETRIMYLENTHSAWAPRQSVKVRKYYIIPFFHDTTPPTCGDVKLYNDQGLSTPFSYGWWWLRETKYYTMVCADPETWCSCDPSDPWCTSYGSFYHPGSGTSIPYVRTKAEALGYKAKPSSNFLNQVNVRAVNCEWNMPWWVSDILYDQKVPKVEIDFNWSNFNSSLEDNREYDTANPDIISFRLKDELSFKASNNPLILHVTDEYLTSSTHWVSWLKSISARFFRIKDQNQQAIPEEPLSGCNFDKTFTDYNSSGSLEITDTRWLNTAITCNDFRKSWKYRGEIEVRDAAWNIVKLQTSFSVYPADISTATSSVTQISLGNKYANNEDSHDYKLVLKDIFWNPIYNKSINIRQRCVWSASCKNLKTIDTPATNALIVHSISWNTTDAWELTFKLKSLLPGTYSESFNVLTSKWDETYTDVSWTMSKTITTGYTADFEKPISVDIKLIDWDTVVQIWKDQKYEIDLQKLAINLIFTDWKLTNLSSPTITHGKAWHSWTSFNTEDIDFWSNVNDYLAFVWNIGATANVLKTPLLSVDWLQVEYMIWWKKVQYVLDTVAMDKTTVWGTCDATSLWVKIYWRIQSSWNTLASTWIAKTTDLEWGTSKVKIRQAAEVLIKNRTPSLTTKVAGVIYTEWDTTYSSVQWILNATDTIIVKNGNFIIDADVTTRIGIMVLQDSYDVLTNYSTSWNIYVNKDVSIINALIYSDWALRSADASGNSYTDEELEKHLEMNGSIFVKHTIGWAIQWSTTYTLPWGKTTSSFDLAENYDLNYVRKVPRTCDGDDTNDYSFSIRYDSTIQKNPPKWFDQLK